MTTPTRIRLSRKKGFRLQETSKALNGLDAVKVDRSTIWGNDCTIEDYGDAETAVEMFEHDLNKFAAFHPEDFAAYIRPLIGKNLACWCQDGKPCHANVLLNEAAAFARFSCKEVA